MVSHQGLVGSFWIIGNGKRASRHLGAKSTFYEQDTLVKGFLCFCLHRALLLSVAPHVVLRRVSIRTLSEPLEVLCLFGVRRRASLPEHRSRIYKTESG